MTTVNTDRFTGFASLYDQARPQAPAKVVDIVGQILGSSNFGTVVDLGSGTGLSTRIWSGAARTLLGIEPTPDMLEQARQTHPDITFQQGTSYDTALESSSVEVLACSQAFHWMEPTSTLKEVARVLQPGGVFVVYDCHWPVSWYWPAEQKYQELIQKAREMVKGIPELAKNAQQFLKEKHLENMKSCGSFEYCGTVLFDNTEACDSERFLGLALSQGLIQDVLKHSPEVLQDEIHQLKQASRASSATEMRVSYTLHYGVKARI